MLGMKFGIVICSCFGLHLSVVWY